MTPSKPKRERVWVRAKGLTPEEKAAIATTCERFIAGVLKPRFLPEICPTQFNYAVEIFGKWRGSSYSFMVRYRSGFPGNTGEEFDSAFTRLDHVLESPGTRFDVMWHRHTGRWWCVCPAVTLDEALQLIETTPTLQPAI